MKKRNAVFAVFLLVAGLALAGCGKLGGGAAGSWDTSVNSIHVTRDMEVESALVYTSAQQNELYQPDELASFVEEAVSAYNQARGAEARGRNEEGLTRLPAALKECSLEGSTGKLVFEYGTPGDLVTFSQETGDNTHTVTAIFVGQAADAAAEGKLAGISFAKPDGKEATAEEAAKVKNGVAVLVSGSATICTEGKIAYISQGTGELTMKDDHTVVTGEGDHCIVFR